MGRINAAVTAIVVLRENASADAVSETELVGLVRARKGPIQAPKRVIFASSIPHTGLGKPDKKALRAAYACQPTNQDTH